MFYLRKKVKQNFETTKQADSRLQNTLTLKKKVDYKKCILYTFMYLIYFIYLIYLIYYMLMEYRKSMKHLQRCGWIIDSANSKTKQTER